MREPIADAIKRFAYDEFVADDLLVHAMAGTAQFWVVGLDKTPQAYLVTRIVTQTRRRVCRVVLVVGKDVDAWYEQAFNVIATWAKKLGCTYGEQYGRDGWVKKLAAHGWYKTHVIMAKEL